MERRRELVGWLVVLGLCLVPVAVWAVSPNPARSFQTPAAAARSVGTALGLAGFTAYALNIVLGARLRLVEPLFGGMDRVYRAHRRLGVVALSLLVGHGVLMVAGLRADTLADAFRLTFVGQGWRISLGVVALSLLIGGVLVTLFVPIAHETLVYVQRVLGAVFALGALHALLVPGSKGTSPALRVYLVGVSLVAGAAYLYRSVLGPWAVPRHRYQVAEVNELDPSAHEIVMSPEATPLRFRPGQFAVLTFLRGNVRPDPHPFSIASGASEPNLRVVVKALGDFTSKIGSLAVGATALVEGPYGGFRPLDHPNPTQVWIAGGIGITPFLSMARSIAGQDNQIDLYYCTERKEEAHFLDELFEIADRSPGLRVIPIRRTWIGYITADDIEAASRDVGNKEIFICGPPVMMKALERQFLAMGVPKARIHSEEFTFT